MILINLIIILVYVFSTKKSRSTLNEKIAGKNTWEKFVEFWEFFDIIGSRLLC